MKKIKLEENMYVYQFEAPAEGRLGTNIHVFTDKKNVLILDAGYEQYLAEVIKDLGDMTIVEILPSHFHPDHIDGIRLVDQPVVYGNKYAEETIKLYMSDELELLKPTHIINEESTIIFGRFEFKFKHAPGHSDCTMITTINDHYMHIGDLYMTLNDGMDVLPYVKEAGLQQHMTALEYIKDHLTDEFLLSHGAIQLDKHSIIEGLNNRYNYLKTILDSANTCTVEEALKNSSKPFELLKWRDDV